MSILSISAALSAAETKRVAVVESAIRQPTEVGFLRRPDLQAVRRLEDPAAGGVLTTGIQGSALFAGPREEGGYSARVAVEFLEPNTTVDVRVIDSDGAELNSVTLSSAEPGGWSGSLYEVPSGSNARVELTVKAGRALGTIYRVGSQYVTTLPILNPVNSRAARGTAAFALARPDGGREPLSPGSSYYTSTYAWPGTSFSFLVAGAPPNTCGDLWTQRNGSWQVAYGWICTDGTGYAEKGPWNITTTFPGQDQSDNPSYVQWPDQTTTTDTWHVIDVTPPTISTSLFAFGQCPFTPPFVRDCPVAGTFSDGPWGSGFNRYYSEGHYGFKDETTGKWWQGLPPNGGYTSNTEVFNYSQGFLELGIGVTSNTVTWVTDLPVTANCPSGHYCTAKIRINDYWTSTTVEGVPLP